MDIPKSVVPTGESNMQYVKQSKKIVDESYTFPDALWVIFSKSIYDALVKEWKVRKSMDELQY
jgi:hypothetical protein